MEEKRAKKNVHVVPHEDGWAVKSGGAARAAKVTATQKEAIEVGKQIATNRGAELLVHGEDGRIRSKDSYGNDPNPPKDKEH